MLLTSTGYGRRVGLRFDDSDESRVREFLPFWWHDDDVEPEKTWQVSSGDVAEYVVRELELWVAEHAVDRVFVHAGVVASDGRALLLPGRSMSGKTTLVAALLEAGAAYGSDEYAVLDGDGLVHPYPRPLSLREDGARRRVSAAESGADQLSGPVPVGLIAVLRYGVDAGWNPRPISRATAVLRLIDNTVSSRRDPEAALAALIRAAGDASAIESARGDATQVARAVLKLIGRWDRSGEADRSPWTGS